MITEYYLGNDHEVIGTYLYNLAAEFYVIRIRIQLRILGYSKPTYKGEYFQHTPPMVYGLRTARGLQL